MIFNRRSFFRHVTEIVAAVALAPEIAFGCKLPTISHNVSHNEFVVGWDIGANGTRRIMIRTVGGHYRDVISCEPDFVHWERAIENDKELSGSYAQLGKVFSLTTGEEVRCTRFERFDDHEAA